MGKVICNREEKVFIKEFNEWIEDLHEYLTDYRDTMVQVMRDTNLKGFKNDDAFIDTAKQAFFHRIHCYYQQEAAMEVVNSIIE